MNIQVQLLLLVQYLMKDLLVLVMIVTQPLLHFVSEKSIFNHPDHSIL